MAATLPNVRSQVACCQGAVMLQATRNQSARRNRSVKSLDSGTTVEGFWLSRVTQTLALRCPETALLPWSKDSSAEPATQPAGQTHCAAMDLRQKVPKTGSNTGHL